jgi:uncharacterized protein YunC (DUF1805 family)
MIVETELIETKRGAAFGVKVKLGDVPLLIVKGEKGYLVCGYFDNKTIEKAKDCCAIVSGAKSFDDMMKKRVDYVSKKAQKLGVKRGMPGYRALDKLI